MVERASVFQPGYNCWRVEPADRVALLIDNDEAFDALKPLLLAARKSIWILAWVFDPLTRLDPDRVRKSGDPRSADRIGLILRRQAALNPALDVRVLTWDMPFPIAAAQMFGPHRGAAFFAGSRVKYRLDATLPASACHHQKAVIIDGVTALVSGGDIGVDRWDDTRHLDENPLRRLPTGRRYPARHEVSMLVDGRAGEAMAERLAEPDGPEVVTIGPARSPSYFDQITMDSARTAAINRLREVDLHHRFTAFSAHTPKGGPIIVHSKVSIIDDEVLRIGSANLNNRSIGLDSECDLAFEARDDLERETIRGFLGRLIGHFIDRSALDVLEAMEREGGLAAAINALDAHGGPPRRLRPVPTRRLTRVQQFIADWNLGDAMTPDDAWRPWGRRKRLRADLARLTAPPPLPPGHLRP